jgi:site-specific recombinase XerC
MDIKRAAKLLRLGDAIAPHSMRKTYAVDMYRATGNLKRVKELLNHKYEATTLLYALADVLTERQAAHTAVIAKG